MRSPISDGRQDARRSYRFWGPIITLVLINILQAIILGFIWADDELRTQADVGQTVVFGLMAAWLGGSIIVIGFAGGTMTATRDRLVWTAIAVPRRASASEVTDIEVVTGRSGMWTRSWLLVRTTTNTYEIRKLGVGLKRTVNGQFLVPAGGQVKVPTPVVGFRSIGWS